MIIEEKNQWEVSIAHSGLNGDGLFCVLVELENPREEGAAYFTPQQSVRVITNAMAHFATVCKNSTITSVSVHRKPVTVLKSV